MEGLSDEAARQTLYSSSFKEFQKSLRGKSSEAGGASPLMDHGDAPSLELGKKRKREDEAADDEPAPSALEGADTALLSGSAEDDAGVLETLSQRASPSAEKDDEQTCSDTGSAADCLEPAVSLTDYRLADQERELGADRMESAARAMVEKGYVVFSANTEWDPKAKGGSGKKSMWPPKEWQESTITSCLTPLFFNPHRNTLLINTAPSRVLVLDFDHADGGMEQLAEWESEHGAFRGPRVRTGSGGVHLYFLHERSVEAGVGADTPTHFAKHHQVVACDVLYEKPSVPWVARMLPELLKAGPSSRVIISDPTERCPGNRAPFTQLLQGLEKGQPPPEQKLVLAHRWTSFMDGELHNVGVLYFTEALQVFGASDSLLDCASSD